MCLSQNIEVIFECETTVLFEEEDEGLLNLIPYLWILSFCIVTYVKSTIMITIILTNNNNDEEYDDNNNVILIIILKQTDLVSQ